MRKKGNTSRSVQKKDDNDESPSCPQKRKLDAMSGKWDPKEACRPIIDEAPIFYPTEEEFKDAIGYLAKIRPLAESYGICKIVPPKTWTPPCPLKDEKIWKNAKFSTRIQPVDVLQNREPMRKKQQQKKKRRGLFNTRKRRRSHRKSVESSIPDSDQFGFQPGMDFTLEEFQKFSDEFKASYFEVNDKGQGFPSVNDIEGEYWRIIENPTDDVEVYYGADLESGTLGSGFPRELQSDCDVDKYVISDWNLLNFSRLPGSVLSFEESNISGVVVPWIYIGMCLSSFCWHVEDHHLYSLNYLHWGDPKVWYGVSSSHATALEGAMRKHLPDLFEERPDLLNELVTQFSPSILKDEGVPSYRVVQNSGEFILTFPRAYHSGFNCGFNCAEAVNVAPIDWLKHGQSAVEQYSEQRRKTSISHDKLLFAAARKAVQSLHEISVLNKENPDNLRWKSFCGKDGMLTEAVKMRVSLEKKRNEHLPQGLHIQKMGEDYDLKERECFSCFYDLHQSAACCNCSLDKFSCLKHENLSCLCDPEDKFILVRYTIDELETLVKALEGCVDSLEICTSKAFPSSRIDVMNVDEKGSLGNDLPTSNNITSSLGIQDMNVDANLNKDTICELKDSKGEVDVAEIGSDCSSNVSNSALDDHLRANSQSLGHTKLFGIDLRTRMKNENVEHQVDKISEHDAYDERSTEFCVEPITIGTVVQGKLWCRKDAIFPKGYKSRVVFFDFRNPLNMVSYCSEILDGGGFLGPVFKVSLEQHPDEAFTCGSPEKCWQLVLQKLRSSQGLPNSSSINGLQMFGLITPSIVQAIEALDPLHECKAYWDNKLPILKLQTILANLVAKTSNWERSTDEKDIADSLGTDSSNSLSDDEIRSVFGRLLRKANTEEMEIIGQLLSKGSTSPLWRVATETLIEEMNRTHT